MKLKHFSVLAGTSLLFSACHFLYDGAAKPSSCCTKQETKQCCDKHDSKKCDKSAAVKSADFSYMDQSVNPSQDFFQYVNGQWIKDNPIPGTESRWGSFNEVSDRNNDVIKTLLENASASTDHEQGSAQQMIGDFYYTIMDSETRTKKGISPIQPQLDAIAKASKEDLAALLANFHMNGFGGVFSAGIDQDLVNNTVHVVNVGQSGQGLPDKDYYFKEDEKSVETRAEYVKHIQTMFELAGMENPAERAASILDMETAFADVSMNRLERRNIQAQYNKMSYADFKASCPSFNWDTYFSGLGLAGRFDTLIVGQPEYFKGLETLLNDKDLAAWQNYLDWKVLNRSASMLTPALEAQNFAFYSGYMRGAKEMKPEWKRAVSTMNWTMGEPLGKAFVETSFSAESKAKVNEMVDNLGAALRERLSQLDWMSDETKEQAYLKLESFMRKLGYPDKWKDMSSVHISRDSYVNNMMEISRFHRQENLDKLGQPIDKTEWGMPAHIVNAYYNPAMNEIVFPAGIMQPPFFDPAAEDAVNYARMGAVIGHEMIHGFDDQGAQFDHEGKFRNWWTEEDKKLFEERTSRLADQYDQYEVLPDVHVNGKLTLGENIADFGGLTMAYYAYQKSLEGKSREKINGFTPEQRFFIAFGQIWKGSATDAFLRQQVVTDPHSPVKFRVNGTLSNMPEFFEAFNIEEGSQMRNPDPIVIW